jgi:putative acetyltransferase
VSIAGRRREQQMKLTIRPEEPRDRAAVYQVNVQAYGREDEAKLVEELRDGNHARLSLVADAGGEIVAHIMFSAVQIMTDAGPMQALVLAPLAVHPEQQQHGLGSTLLKDGLYLAAQRHHRVILVVGDPAFYTRFGFSRELTKPLKCRLAGETFMALELVAGALRGVEGMVLFPPPFAGPISAPRADATAA